MGDTHQLPLRVRDTNPSDATASNYGEQMYTVSQKVHFYLGALTFK